ncbi:MAG: hypothetical protein H7Z75_19200 [Ferruginibacter sp.]|nr:hypothetical protein [Cytophagales bacterium]
MKRTWLLTTALATIGSLAFAQSDFKNTDCHAQRKAGSCHRRTAGSPAQKLSPDAKTAAGVENGVRSSGCHGKRSASGFQNQPDRSLTMAPARFEVGMNYAYFRPQQEMGTFIRQAHGLNGQAMYLIPKSPLAVGVDLGFGMYGYQNTRQTYVFSDGATTETDVRVSNTFLTANLVARLDLIRSGTFIPYLSGKVGYNHYMTNLVIENPDDPDGCRPLENKDLVRDGAFSETVGAGVRWDLGNVFRGTGAERLYADLSAHYTNGGRVSYMNVNIPSDPNPATHQHQPAATSGDAASYVARFVNPRTQVVHEHHVGDVYTSPIQLWEFKLGLVYRLAR